MAARSPRISWGHCAGPIRWRDAWWVGRGQQLQLALGYSHGITLVLPPQIKVAAAQEKGKNPIIRLESPDKQLIGQVAAKLRSLRKPEPYKGKGVRFVGEVVRRKAGKAAGK